MTSLSDFSKSSRPCRMMVFFLMTSSSRTPMQVNVAAGMMTKCDKYLFDHCSQPAAEQMPFFLTLCPRV